MCFSFSLVSRLIIKVIDTDNALQGRRQEGSYTYTDVQGGGGIQKGGCRSGKATVNVESLSRGT